MRPFHRNAWLAGAACAGLAVTLISCANTETKRTAVIPPAIDGAQFVGSQTCADCHAEIVRDFKTASHARLVADGDHNQNIGCESCHGPGSLHNESGGEARFIVNPNRSPDTCFQCHLDLKGQFNLPHTHPVVEGRMNCSACHNPHKGSAIKGGGTALAREHDTCHECHSAQRGPFVFEHEALREGCTSCHKPHGSVNAKMLTERNAMLCIKCHFQQQTIDGQILVGGVNHANFLRQGTCWSGGCHEAVHGSHVSTSLRF